MAAFGMLLKSYAGDLEYAQRLIRSFHAHNVDELSLYCVVPEQDIPLFHELSGPNVTVMSEEPFAQYFTHEPVWGIRTGYINQEIVKLAFWESGLLDAYFCVDSDAEFVRDFTTSDFIAPDGYPFEVLVEDRELLVEPRYFRDHGQTRSEAICRIADEIGWKSPIVLTCHGHQVFSGEVLKSFRQDFLNPRGWSYLDALKVAPLEFTWYNVWLQASQVIPIHPREPWVKVFHHEDQCLEYALRGITNEDIARGYLAVVVNSNYSRGQGVVESAEPRDEVLARHMTYPDMARIFTLKIRDTVRRRLGR